MSKTAIDWVRSKAEFKGANTLTVTDNDAPGQYESKVYGFVGRLPARMINQLRKELSALVKTDKIYESMTIGGKYRSDFNLIQYGRFEYTKI